MPANTSSTTLYRIDECSDVMADACVGDDQGNLIFQPPRWAYRLYGANGMRIGPTLGSFREVRALAQRIRDGREAA